MNWEVACKNSYSQQPAELLTLLNVGWKDVTLIVSVCTFKKTNLSLEVLFLDQFHPPSELDVHVGVQRS